MRRWLRVQSEMVISYCSNKSEIMTLLQLNLDNSRSVTSISYLRMPCHRAWYRNLQSWHWIRIGNGSLYLIKNHFCHLEEWYKMIKNSKNEDMKSGLIAKMVYLFLQLLPLCPNHSSAGYTHIPDQNLDFHCPCRSCWTSSDLWMLQLIRQGIWMG